jgi:hypothetical protein
METPNEISIRRLLSAAEAETANSLRRIMLHQVIYFLMESGHPKELVARDLQAILALPEGVAPPTGSPMMPKETLAYGEVLTAWRSDPAYLDDRGLPQVLAIRSSDPEARTFARLCREIYPTMEPEAVMSFLKEYRAIIDRGSEVEMTESYLRLNKKDRESAMYSVMVLAGLLNTMTLNRRDTARLFQRGTFVGDVDPDAIEAVSEKVGDGFMNQIEAFDKWMLQHRAPPGTAGVPVMVGVYMSVGEPSSDAPDA